MPYRREYSTREIMCLQAQAQFVYYYLFTGLISCGHETMRAYTRECMCTVCYNILIKSTTPWLMHWIWAQNSAIKFEGLALLLDMYKTRIVYVHVHAQCMLVMWVVYTCMVTCFSQFICFLIFSNSVFVLKRLFSYAFISSDNFSCSDLSWR